ncbi:ACT domain-containing protein [Dysgonomonas sp. 521]|uniref:ACT domain-containing protein n=1 Tax=Dysgonomonas sp. 521 TaxID=2302932 RepID=UPI0013D445C9|nr:ACT domain-containing protein [Dysgonomonas sp. 521]NDV94970.1 ACT domain-containing protein [Dysgonomonas sp. 521]
MELKIINKVFSVCKVRSADNIKFDDEFCFVSKTDQEISLVCEESSTPADCIVSEKGWKAFRLEGLLDFSLVGILSKISKILADNEISIFAISTFNTDYILIKIEDFDKAIDALQSYNYRIS